jgi:hypothetical protein
MFHARKLCLRETKCILLQVGSRLQHKAVSSAIVIFYLLIGYKDLVPASTLALVAEGEAALMIQLMSWARSQLRRTQTVSSRWKMVSALKEQLADTRRSERCANADVGKLEPRRLFQAFFATSAFLQQTYVSIMLLLCRASPGHRSD